MSDILNIYKLEVTSFYSFKNVIMECFENNLLKLDYFS